MNYYGITKTNYFRVEDETAYRHLFNNLSSDSEIEDWTYTDKDGTTYHGFGSLGSIDFYDEDEDDFDMNWFFDKLQEILPDDEVFTITEIGNEGLRYVGGGSTLVSSTEIQHIDLNQQTEMLAEKMKE